MANRMKKNTARAISFTGFIQEVEFEDGEIGLQIDDGDRAYRIVMDKTGSKLGRYIDEEVDVKGLMTNTSKGFELNVNTFRLTEGFYYDAEDVYEEGDGYDDDDERFSY